MGKVQKLYLSPEPTRKNVHFPLRIVHSSTQKNQRFFQSTEHKLPLNLQAASQPHHLELCRCFMPRKPVYSLMFCSVPLLPGELDNVLKSCKYLSLSFLCVKPSSCTKQKATQAQYQELEEFVQVCYVRVQKSSCQPHTSHFREGAWG